MSSMSEMSLRLSLINHSSWLRSYMRTDFLGLLHPSRRNTVRVYDAPSTHCIVDAKIFGSRIHAPDEVSSVVRSWKYLVTINDTSIVEILSLISNDFSQHTEFHIQILRVEETLVFSIPVNLWVYLLSIAGNDSIHVQNRIAPDVPVLSDILGYRRHQRSKCPTLKVTDILWRTCVRVWWWPSRPNNCRPRRRPKDYIWHEDHENTSPENL